MGEMTLPTKGVDCQDAHHGHLLSLHTFLGDCAPGIAHARLPFDPGGGDYGYHPGKCGTVEGLGLCLHQHTFERVDDQSQTWSCWEEEPGQGHSRTRSQR